MFVTISRILLLILSHSPPPKSDASLHFVPANQFEDRTVTTECSLHLWFAWTSRNDFVHPHKMQFEFNGEVVAEYLIAEGHKEIIPPSRRKVKVDFIKGSPQDVHGYTLKVSILDLRCEDGYKDSYCRAHLQFRGGIELVVTQGRPTVIGRPYDIKMLINGIESSHYEGSLGELVTLRCTWLGPDSLSVRWLRHFPLYNTMKVISSMETNPHRVIAGTHKRCNHTIYSYTSAIKAVLKQDEPFSVYHCAIYARGIDVVGTSIEAALIVQSKPVKASGKGYLISGPNVVKLPQDPSNFSMGAYEGEPVSIYCNFSTVISVRKANQIRVVKLQLTHVQRHPGADLVEREICTFDPVSEQYGNNMSLNTSLHPSSEMITSWDGTLATDNQMSMRWDIKASCVGNGTYKCAVWFYVGTQMFSDATYQHIYFQCNVQAINITGALPNGTLIPAEEAKPRQKLKITCEFMGPTVVTWHIFKDGGYLVPLVSTVQRGIPRGPDQPGCVCYRHTVRFDIVVPDIAADQEVKLIECTIAVPGSSKTMSYIVNKQAIFVVFDKLILILVTIGLILFLIALCAILLVFRE